LFLARELTRRRDLSKRARSRDAFALPPAATKLALDSVASGHSTSEIAATVLSLIGSLSMITVLVILAPVAGLRRKDVWKALLPGYGEYYIVVTTWRCGAAILRMARQREQQRHRSATVQPTAGHAGERP
jgi:hypothetical protein